jgi:hypothetical protein
MIAVVKSAGATVANKALELVVQDASGLLADVQAAWFQIFDTTTADKEAAPEQIFPTTVGNREPIDVTLQRLGTGRYAAVWATDSGATLGRYTVRWWYRFNVSDTPIAFDQEFELAPMAYQGPHYCSLYDLRAGGLASTGIGAVSDAVAQKLIVQASRWIEHYTGRQFDWAYKIIRAGGQASRALLLDEPIIALESVIINYSGDFIDQDRQVGNFTVFNRHIRENLFLPDDRDDPKLEFLHGWDFAGVNAEYSRYDYRFSAGVQNVRVAGVFGYTEPDQSMVGCTPTLIRQACQIIAFKQRFGPGSSSREEVLNQSRVTSEYTRDQGFIYAKPGEGRAAPFISHLGDPEVDAILYGFIRPPQFGAA